MEQKIVTVSQLNRYIKSLLDGNPNLNMVYVRGELSNYKLYPSGHHYFTLKDEEASLRCVLFKRESCSLGFRPEKRDEGHRPGPGDGVSARTGSTSSTAGELIPDGVGALHVAC